MSEALRVLRNENANIIGAPVRAEQQIDPFRKARLIEVFISSDLSKKEVYAQSGGLALTKVALEKLAIAASMTFRTVEIKSDREYCRATVEGFWTNSSGETISDRKTAELDLDVLQDELGNTDPKKVKEFQQVRKFKIPLTESKAKNRVIRSLLGLKSTYTAEELSKPFTFPVVAFSPDFNDPEIKNAVIQKFLGSGDALFGGVPKMERLPEVEQVFDIPEAPESLEYEDFFDGVEEVAKPTPSAPVAQEQYPEPPEESAITEPCPKCGVMMIYREGKRKDGTPWTGLFCPKNRKDDPQCDQEPKWGWKPNQTKDMFGGEPNF
jgi:hypothetical protein